MATGFEAKHSYSPCHKFEKAKIIILKYRNRDKHENSSNTIPTKNTAHILTNSVINLTAKQTQKQQTDELSMTERERKCPANI